MNEASAAHTVRSSERRITSHDLEEFARISGDNNPIHVDAAYAATTSFERPVAHGMFLFSLVRGQLRQHWPTARLLEQRVQFLAPTPVGSLVTIQLTVAATDADAFRIATTVTGQDGSVGLTGDCVLRLVRGDDR